MGTYEELNAHFARERAGWRREAVAAVGMADRILQELHARWAIPGGALRLVPLPADERPHDGEPAPPAEAPATDAPRPALTAVDVLRYREGRYELPFVLTFTAGQEPLEVRFDFVLRCRDEVWYVDTGGEEDEYRLPTGDPEAWNHFAQGFWEELREDLENAAWSRPEQAPRIGFRQSPK